MVWFFDTDFLEKDIFGFESLFETFHGYLFFVVLIIVAAQLSNLIHWKNGRLTGNVITFKTGTFYPLSGYKNRTVQSAERPVAFVIQSA